MKSDKVSVFPCVNRDAIYSNASKLMSEQNITSMIKNLTDMKSYVINNNPRELEFVIDGYYFKLLEPISYPAYAILKKDGDLLKGDNDSGKFEGLVITQTNSEGALCLLNASGNIPPESKFKLTPESVRDPASIDCGELY